MVRARPRDANINASSTTLSFDHCILCIHTHWETKSQFERVGFFSFAHASSSAELVPLVCFHRGLEKYTSISPTLSGMYSVKFSFCPVVVFCRSHIIYRSPPHPHLRLSNPPPPYLEMVIFIIFINNNNGQTTIRPGKLEFESVPLPPPSWGGGGWSTSRGRVLLLEIFTFAIPSSVTSSSSSATFLFGPSYDTHVPNRNVLSIVGVEEGAGMTGGGATGPAFDGRGDGLRQGGWRGNGGGDCVRWRPA